MKKLEQYSNLRYKELDKIAGVYIIENSINNKRYIGESKNLALRLNQHILKLLNNQHDNHHLQKAVNIYGIENFKFDIIELCNVWETKRREHHWVTILYTYDRDFGYNIQPTDPEGLIIVSEETRLKISNSRKGKPLSEAQKLAISNANKGRKFTEEHKKKIGNSNKGNIISPEIIERIRLKNIGKKRYEEAKRKQSITRKLTAEKNGYYTSPETSEKIRKANLGKIRSEEQRANMRKPKNLTKEQREYLSYRAKYLTKHHSRPIVCLDLKGKLVKFYKSAAEASKHLCIKASWIRDCLKERIKYVKTYIFVYVDLYDINKDYVAEPKNKKEVQKFSKDGILLAEYSTVMEAATENNVKSCSVSTVCLHYFDNRYKNSTLNGYIYKFKNK